MKMVEKTSSAERYNHWLLMLSFFVLALTGFGFAFESLNWLNSIFGGNHLAKDIHRWAGVVFFLSVLFTISSYLGESLSFTQEDSEWIKLKGGYFSKVDLPAQGRLNAGQKLFYLMTLAVGIVIGITGLVIWLASDSQSAVRISLLFHNIAFVIFVSTVPVHIYLATASNPGTFRIMTKGTIPLDWAKKKHARWVKEMGFE